jgi:hypothetical protein
VACGSNNLPCRLVLGENVGHKSGCLARGRLSSNVKHIDKHQAVIKIATVQSSPAIAQSASRRNNIQYQPERALQQWLY